MSKSKVLAKALVQFVCMNRAHMVGGLYYEEVLHNTVNNPTIFIFDNHSNQFNDFNIHKYTRYMCSRVYKRDFRCISC